MSSLWCNRYWGRIQQNTELRLLLKKEWLCILHIFPTQQFSIKTTISVRFCCANVSNISPPCSTRKELTLLFQSSMPRRQPWKRTFLRTNSRELDKKFLKIWALGTSIQRKLHLRRRHESGAWLLSQAALGEATFISTWHKAKRKQEKLIYRFSSLSVKGGWNRLQPDAEQMAEMLALANGVGK